MSTARPVRFTRRAGILVPFVFAYGLAVYLAMGAVGDAFSGQPAAADSSVLVERGSGAAGQTAVKADAVADAVAAVEETPAIRDLVRDQKVSVLRSGAWTPGTDHGDAPAPTADVGVALTIELPEPTDVDLSQLPGVRAVATDSRGPGPGRTLAGARSDAPQIEENVTELLVLYDPAQDEIVAVHPVPRQAPAPPSELGPAPRLEKPNLGADRQQRAERRRTQDQPRAKRVTRRG